MFGGKYIHKYTANVVVGKKNVATEGAPLTRVNEA